MERKKKMRINPLLSFDGQCEAAFKFYEKCLGGKIVFLMRYGDAPGAESAPPGWRDKVIHATFALGDHVLQGADNTPETYVKPQGFVISLSIGPVEEAERIFKALAEDGVVQMPLQETFWALRFGMVVDRFGTPWVINCENPEAAATLAPKFGRPE
jgi:PhnB protein